MPTQLQLRRGNTAQTATFTGAVAEITVDTDKKTVVVHDGTTAGGFALALESAQLDQFAFTKANLAFDRANSAFAQANAAFDTANTKFNSAGGTISGNVIVTGNVTPTTDNVYSLGSVGNRWKDLFVGPGSINIDGIVIGNTGGNIVISGASDFVFQSTTGAPSVSTASSANIALNAFNQANLAFNQANTSYGSFAQANLAYTQANSSYGVAVSAFAQANLAFTAANNAVDTWVRNQANAAYDAANSAVTTGQANVGAGLITVTNAYQANVGAGLITVTSAYQANAGAGQISAITAGQANVGAARIADVASGQANVGASIITVSNNITNVFNQANLAYDAANTAVTAGQANVGAGLITVTSAYQANAGAGIITANNNLKNYVDATFLPKTGGTISSDLTISGSLTVSGTFTTINTEEINLADNEIILNSNHTTNVMPTQNAGIIINRGNLANSPNVFIRYDEVNDYWVLRDNVGQFIIATAANVGVGLITATNAGQANVGAAVISVTSAYQANVGAGLITEVAARQANIGASVITLSNNITNVFNQANLAYTAANSAVTTGQANVGAAVISVTSAYQANVGSAIGQGQANTGAGLITEIAARQANVGAGLITVTSAYQANVGAVNIAKVNKAGDVMTGALSTSGAIIGSSLTANTIATINTNAVYESTAVTTAAATQFTLDSFSTTAYRSAKYLVQISSGSSYELLEMTLIHDGTTVYLSQYGNIKTGATLGVFDATISTGTLSLLATPNNAVTTFKTAITLIPT